MAKRNKRKHSKKAWLKKNLLGWAFMIPALALFLFFVWVPLGKNITMSFFLDRQMEEFAGFANYLAIFEDETFLKALGNTFIYIGYSIAIGFFVPIIIGFLLSETMHFRGVFRVLVYLPAMISGIAVVFLFREIYNDEPYGILNVITEALGGEAHLWMSDSALVIPLIVVAMTWRGAGSTSLIYLNAFSQIDGSMYEASRLDGANPFQRFLRLTLPAIKTTVLTLLVLQVISVFQVFYEPMIIGRGMDDSMTLMYLTYQYAFEDGEVNLSAASSVVLAIIILLFTGLYYGLKAFLERGERKRRTRRGTR